MRQSNWYNRQRQLAAEAHARRIATMMGCYEEDNILALTQYLLDNFKYKVAK